MAIAPPPKAKGYIAPSFIQTLLANVDIVRVIGQHLPLKAKGGDHWACCPFHEETTPSFSVSPDKQFYHCFGCGVHGNAIDFLMEYEHITFPEAIHQLAAWAGMEVVYEARPHLSNNTNKPATKPVISQEADYADLAACAAYYQARLNAEHTAYLEARGVNVASIAQFYLGYAPNRDDLAGAQLPPARLLELGMLMQRDKDGRTDAGHGQTLDTARTFARFQDRLMFPIHTARGKVAGFGARALREGQNPKYLNSAESSLFHKGKLIYGLYQALQVKRRPDYLIVTEGYMDVIAMHQAGFPMAVACMGTAMTETQLAHLFRRTKRVVLCYDGDTAGRAATEKAVRLALPHLAADEQLNIATLPIDADPDDVIQKEGAEALGAHIERAQGVIEYILANLANMGSAARADDLPRLTLAAEQWYALTPENAWRSALKKAIMDAGIALPETAEPQQHSAGRRGDGRFNPSNQALRERPDTEIKTPDWATHMLAIALAYPHAITAADKADLALLTDTRIAILLEIFKHQAAHPDWRSDVLLAPWQHDEGEAWLRQAETYARTHITSAERAAREKAALLAALQAQQARTMFAALSEQLKHRQTTPLGQVESALYLTMNQTMNQRQAG